MKRLCERRDQKSKANTRREPISKFLVLERVQISATQAVGWASIDTDLSLAGEVYWLFIPHHFWHHPTLIQGPTGVHASFAIPTLKTSTGVFQSCFIGDETIPIFG